MSRLDKLNDGFHDEALDPSIFHSTFAADEFEKRWKERDHKRLYTAAELIALNMKEPPMLWDTYLQQVGVACLVGPSDSGKSTLTKQLAERIATGQPELFNQALHIRTGKALFIVTEDNVEAVAATLNLQAIEGNMEGHKNIYFLWMDNPNLVEQELEQFLKTTPVDLVVIDVWMDIFCGNPNNMVDVRKEVRTYGKIARQYNSLILFIHHTSKHGSLQDPHKNGVNGSQGIEARMRSVLDLRNVKEDLFSLTIVKGNYVKNELKNKPRALRLDSKTRTFFVSEATIDFTHSRNRLIYNNETMMDRIYKLRDQGLAIEKIHSMLQGEFRPEDCPGLTTLKKFIKDHPFPNDYGGDEDND